MLNLALNLTLSGMVYADGTGAVTFTGTSDTFGDVNITINALQTVLTNASSLDGTVTDGGGPSPLPPFVNRILGAAPGFPLEDMFGEEGMPGLPGRHGMDGTIGRDGVGGLPGIDSSEDGLDGLPGPLGQSGNQGIQGIQGVPGFLAYDGEDGDPGLPGPQGVGGYPSFTANPTSWPNNSPIYRSDLGRIIYYDGTRWLTEHEYEMDCGYPSGDVALVGGATANPSTISRQAVRTDFGMYLTRWAVQTRIPSGTNNATNFWTVSLQYNTNVLGTTTISSFTTAADTITNYFPHDQTINAVLSSTAVILLISAAKTNTPSAIIVPSTLFYRLIIT